MSEPMMTVQHFTVGKTKYHCENGSWWCEDERLPGWTGVADTQAECEALRREAMVLAPVQAALDGVLTANSKLALDLAAAQAREVELREALEELHEVASLRGDNALPHPCDDPKTWTARMQTAWDAIPDLLSRAPSTAALRAMLERAASDGASEGSKASCGERYLTAPDVVARILASEGGHS